VPLPKFSYLWPRNLKEASALLVEHGDKAKVLAGGTDLLIRMSHRAVTPDYLIGLKALSGLDQVTYHPDTGLTIGALARLAEVADHPEILAVYPALSHAAQMTATVQIRNMGTVAGNICNAAPSADTAPPLLVYEAEVQIVHPGGERSLPMHDFFRGPGLTALETGEIVKEIRLPAPDRRTGSCYQKLSARSKVDIAAVGIAALVQLDESGRCRQARLALGAVAPVPLRARRTEKMLLGERLEPDLLREAGAGAADEASPISDVRASAQYRRQMIQVLTERALSDSLSMAQQKIAGCDA